MSPLLFLIPLSILAALVLWVWMMMRTLRENEGYLWLTLLVVVPPVGVLFYAGYLLLASDRIPGMQGALPRWRAMMQARQLERQLRDTDTISVRMQLARQYATAARWDRALAHLEHVLAQDPDDLPAQTLAGKALLDIGKPAHAAAHLQFVVDQDPGHDFGRARCALVEALVGMGRSDAAAPHFDALLTGNPSPEIVCRLQAFAAPVSREALARDALRQVVERYAGEPLDRLPTKDRFWVDTARRRWKAIA